MMGILIIIAAGVTVIGITILLVNYHYKQRKEMLKTWQVGDKLYPKLDFHLNNPDASQAFAKSGKEFLTLVGFTMYHVFVKIDGITYKIEFKYIDFNKSAIWRENYDTCKEFMGTEPDFNPVIGESDSSNDNIDGKPIELLTEIECQIYLKQALEEEKFELAEKIRQQMQKYR